MKTTPLVNQPESDIVKRIKNERINRGSRYIDYLTPRQKYMLKKGTQVSTKNHA